MIRKSTKDDEQVIRHLMSLCFGNRDSKECLDSLDKRYYLYFEDGILVAMTGLIFSEAYRHLEVDWTCTHPEHRNKGYMKELFTEMLEGVDEPVYCSCWRLPDKEQVNLHTLMTLFGFEEVVHVRAHFKVPFNCFRYYEGDCVYHTGPGCECFEDLYLRQ